MASSATSVAVGNFLLPSKTFLTALVKGRTKTVLDLLADNPTLKKQTQDLDKSIAKLKKSIKKAKKSSDRVGGSNVGQPFRDLQKQIDKKYGGKY